MRRMNRGTVQHRYSYSTMSAWAVLAAALFFLPTANAATDYSDKSDEELTVLTSQWADLAPADRRALLAEVRGRMNAPQQASNTIKPRVKITRRYGRIVRKSDGSVVVQTIVEPAQAETGQVSVQQGSGRITFGFGFERRSKRTAKPNTEVVKGTGQETASDSGL